MPYAQQLFTLRANHWYAWQMLPGYVGEEEFCPYYSPIHIQEITPLQTGTGLIRIKFLNAAYASGVQQFDTRVRVLKRAHVYMLVEIAEGSGPYDRAAIIGKMDFSWLKQNLPGWFEASPPEHIAEPHGSDVQLYLDDRLLGGELWACDNL